MGDLSASVRLKLNRANEHLEGLKQLVTPWDNPNAYKFVTEIEDNTDLLYGHLRYVIRVARPLPTDELSKILGACISNFRCVLDHLIWELSLVHSGPKPPRPMAIKFPARMSGHGSGGLHAVSPRVSADVQWLHANCPPLDAGDPSPFTMLCELSNVDKHASIHVVHHTPKNIDIKVTPTIIGTRIEKIDPGMPLQDGTVIARIAIPRPVWQREVHQVHSRMEHGVAIAKTSRTPEAHLGRTVEGIKHAVTETTQLLKRHLP